MVNEPQREILVFDIADQQKQRDNLEEQLDSQATVRQISKVVGGLIVVIGAAVVPSLRPLLKREDNEEMKQDPKEPQMRKAS